MSVLQVIYFPDRIFKEKAEEISEINTDIKKIAEDMLDTMYFEGAVGLGANMLGLKLRIVVIDLRVEGSKAYVMINPKITFFSSEKVEFEEASISFPGISAVISRPEKIKVSYQDIEGNFCSMDAEGFLARVIQHEVDYLDGKVFLDYLSKLKQDMLIKKMQKYIKNHPPHVHGAHCHH